MEDSVAKFMLITGDTVYFKYSGGIISLKVARVNTKTVKFVPNDKYHHILRYGSDIVMNSNGVIKGLNGYHDCKIISKEEALVEISKTNTRDKFKNFINRGSYSLLHDCTIEQMEAINKIIYTADQLINQEQ